MRERHHHAYFLAVASALIAISSRGFAHPELKSAFRLPDGNWLLEVSKEQGSGLYWSKGHELSELDLIDEETHEHERLLRFEDPTNQNTTPEVKVTDSTARLSCEGSEIPLAHANQKERTEWAKALKSSSVRVRALPSVRVPRFLFKVEGSKDFVYVTEPAFGFHGNYEVFIGPPGRWRKVALREETGDWKKKQPGLISFASGGGIFVPITIDLLGEHSGHRGEPTLVREKAARTERLLPHGLSLHELTKLGIRKVAIRTPETPCTLTALDKR